MAKAEKTKIERVITEEGVVLQLTMPEARALFAILWRVGGSPVTSPRGLADGIRNALTEAATGYPQAKFSIDYEQWAMPELTCFTGGGGLIAKNYDSKEEK